MHTFNLIEDFLEAHTALTEACRSFSCSITQTDIDLPFLLPDYSGPLNSAADKRAAKSLAAKSMTQLWHLDSGEHLPAAGLLCAGTETLAKAGVLNDAKLKFKKSVIALRNKNTHNKSSIDKLIDQILLAEPERPEQLSAALKRSQLSRLDLLRCYANIRILPSNLHSISWTWARTHSTSKTVSVAEARKLGEALQTEALRRMVADMLSGYQDDDLLAYKKKLPNRLQANLVWKEDDQMLRKAVTISGIVLSPDLSLPKYIWRSNPDKGDKPLPSNRLRRIDAKIMPEPFIKALKLHEIKGSL